MDTRTTDIRKSASDEKLNELADKIGWTREELDSQIILIDSPVTTTKDIKSFGIALSEAAHNLYGSIAGISLSDVSDYLRETAPVGKQRARQVSKAVRAANQVKKRRSAAKLQRKTKRKNRNK